MNTRKLLSVLIVVTVCCSKNDEVPCLIVKEAITGHYDDIYVKYLFTHDGVNYTGMQGYVYNNANHSFSTESSFTGTFTYHSGKVSSAIYNYPTSNFSYRYEFSYVDGEVTRVITRLTTLRDGVVSDTQIYSNHYIESPKDSTYFIADSLAEPVLEVYEKGNLTKLGFQDSTGTYQTHDTTWRFSVGYQYDQYPNAVKDYALQYLIYAPNRGFCRNNMIKEIGAADTATPYSKSQTFSFFDNVRLRKWIYEDTGQSVAFNYGCN